MRQRYRNKIPPFKPDSEHWTRKSCNGWKAKEDYDTEDGAWEWLNEHPRVRAQGYTAYQCRVCMKWHVGHIRDKKIQATEK